MKIDMLCNVLLDTSDAQPIHVMEVFKNLRDLGHEVNLTAPKTQNAMPELSSIAYFSTLHSKVMMVEAVSRIAGLSSYYILSLVRHKKPDVIYQRFSVAMLLIPLLSKFFKIPYVVEINGIMEDEMALNNVPSLYIRFAKRVEEFNCKHAKRIVAVTQGIKEAIQKAYDTPGDKIVVIENGANTELFKPIDANKAKEELNLDKSSNYICFVGSFERWQGIEYLINTIPYILEECPLTRLLIVGDGRIKKELIELAEQLGVSDKVIFTGMVPYEKVSLYINASDVCVVPKKPLKSGYSPLKLCEYMACEKPVVATRTSGFEVLEEHDAGLLINPEDPGEFTNTIVKLLQNKGLRKQMGGNGRKYVVENQSWESVARKVAEVCESIVSGEKADLRKLNEPNSSTRA